MLESANADRAKAAEWLIVIDKVCVVNFFEAVRQENVHSLEQFFELCAGGVIQIFELSEVEYGDVVREGAKQVSCTQDVETKVVRTKRDVLQYR